MKKIKRKIRKTLIASIYLLTLLGTSNIMAQGWIRHFTDSLLLEKLPVTDRAQNGNIVLGQSLLTDDYHLLMVDSEGILLWEKVWTPYNIQRFQGMDIHVAKDGGIVNGGYYFNNSLRNPVLFKTDANGNELWNSSINTGAELSHIAENDNGEIAGIGYASNSSNALFFMSVSPSGSIIANKLIQFPTNYSFHRVSGIEHNLDQTFTIIFGYSTGPNNIEYTDFVKVDVNGNILSTITDGDGISSFIPRNTKVYPNGDLLHMYSEYGLAGAHLKLTKMTAGGTVIWDNFFIQNSGNPNYIYDMKIDLDNEIYITAFIGNPKYPIVFKTDSVGTEVWSTSFQNYFNAGYVVNLDLDPDGNAYIGGLFTFNPPQGNAFDYHSILKLDGQGNMYTGYIKGNIVFDKNQNCVAESSDLPFPDNRVMAYQHWPFLGYTDSLGNYFMNVDTGTFEVKTIPNNPIFSSCSGPVTVQISSYDTIEIDFIEKPIVKCPNMTVDISTPFLRRCFPNTYYVEYCNQGSAMAYDVSLEIELDQYLTVLSSSIPITSQNGNMLFFELDSVDIFECNTFRIQVLVDCDSTVLGQTHCVEAHIYPDSLCLPTNNWDGSITDVNATCLGDSILFEITNTGLGDMSTPQGYIVTQDDIIRSSLSYQLLAGQTFSFKYAADGSTYRLSAIQAPGRFPSNYVPTVAVEGCGFYDPITMQYSIGFVTQFNEDDVLDYVSIDCQENRASYDPNDKRAEPKGYGAEHYIEENTDIEYHIRFQNVGTDTAFTVVIRDQLSPHLDISNLQLGVSSHPYDFSLVNGNMMNFTFNDIKLVDSTTNEAGSHGFVKFKIAQQPNLPLGTIINNSAAIYFDFNEPVITNTTFHEIGEDFVQVMINNEEVTDYPLLDVAVYPNPFVDQATIEVKNGPQQPMSIIIYDTSGKTILQEQFENSYQLQRQIFGNGIYHFSIFSEGKIVGSGKIIAL